MENRRTSVRFSLGSKSPEVLGSSDVQLVVGDGRRRRDVLTEIVARQHFQCVAGSKDDDSAGLAGGVNATVGRYRRGDIGLRILPLFPNDQALGLFAGLVPASSFVADKALAANAGTAERQSVVAGFPLWLVLLEGLLLIGLAANEYFGRSLRWSTA